MNETSARDEFFAMLRQFDALWDAGQGESAEAELLRDKMDGPWYRMTAEEKEQANRYCEDNPL